MSTEINASNSRFQLDSLSDYGFLAKHENFERGINHHGWLASLILKIFNPKKLFTARLSEGTVEFNRNSLIKFAALNNKIDQSDQESYKAVAAAVDNLAKSLQKTEPVSKEQFFRFLNESIQQQLPPNLKLDALEQRFNRHGADPAEVQRDLMKLSDEIAVLSENRELQIRLQGLQEKVLIKVEEKLTQETKQMETELNQLVKKMESTEGEKDLAPLKALIERINLKGLDSMLEPAFAALAKFEGIERRQAETIPAIRVSEHPEMQKVDFRLIQLIDRPYTERFTHSAKLEAESLLDAYLELSQEKNSYDEQALRSRLYTLLDFQYECKARLDLRQVEWTRSEIDRQIKVAEVLAEIEDPSPWHVAELETVGGILHELRAAQISIEARPDAVNVGEILNHSQQDTPDAKTAESISGAIKLIQVKQSMRFERYVEAATNEFEKRMKEPSPNYQQILGEVNMTMILTARFMTIFQPEGTAQITLSQKLESLKQTCQNQAEASLKAAPAVSPALSDANLDRAIYDLKYAADAATAVTPFTDVELEAALKNRGHDDLIINAMMAKDEVSTTRVNLLRSLTDDEVVDILKARGQQEQRIRKALLAFNQPAITTETTKSRGMTNLGATCYMNAALQTIRRVPGFRREVELIAKTGSGQSKELAEALLALLDEMEASKGRQAVPSKSIEKFWNTCLKAGWLTMEQYQQGGSPENPARTTHRLRVQQFDSMEFIRWLRTTLHASSTSIHLEKTTQRNDPVNPQSITQDYRTELVSDLPNKDSINEAVEAIHEVLKSGEDATDEALLRHLIHSHPVPVPLPAAREALTRARFEHTVLNELQRNRSASDEDILKALPASLPKEKALEIIHFQRVRAEVESYLDSHEGAGEKELKAHIKQVLSIPNSDSVVRRVVRLEHVSSTPISSPQALINGLLTEYGEAETAQSTIRGTPPYFFLNLNRGLPGNFEPDVWNRMSADARNTALEKGQRVIPREKSLAQVNLKETVVINGQRYRPHAVILHGGSSVTGGHYTALVQQENQLRLCNDTSQSRAGTIDQHDYRMKAQTILYLPSEN